MNAKTQYLNKLKALDALSLEMGTYAITGGGPLAIRNLRGADDVDIVVIRDVFDELSKKYVPYDENHIRIGVIEVWGDFINLTERMDEAIASSEWIEGYPFVSLEDTLSWKKFLNREKDQKDIALIEAYLQNRMFL